MALLSEMRPWAKGALRWVPDDEILLDGELEDQTLAQAVIRDMGKAHIEMMADGGLGDRLAVQTDVAAFHLAAAHDGLAQLQLTVAVYAGDADDLTGMDREGDTVHCGEGLVAIDAELLDLQQRPSGLLRVI